MSGINRPCRAARAESVEAGRGWFRGGLGGESNAVYCGVLS